MPAQGASLKFCVTASGGPLKVTLVWNDKPNALSAATQLVNDLDLIVYANYSRIGNGFPDHINNVEQVSQLPSYVIKLCLQMHTLSMHSRCGFASKYASRLWWYQATGMSWDCWLIVSGAKRPTSTL